MTLIENSNDIVYLLIIDILFTVVFLLRHYDSLNRPENKKSENILIKISIVTMILLTFIRIVK